MLPSHGDAALGRSSLQIRMPHIALQQARNFVSMLVKGDEHEGSLLRDTARQVLSAVLPGDK